MELGYSTNLQHKLKPRCAVWAEHTQHFLGSPESQRKTALPQLTRKRGISADIVYFETRVKTALPQLMRKRGISGDIVYFETRTRVKTALPQLMRKRGISGDIVHHDTRVKTTTTANETTENFLRYRSSRDKSQDGTTTANDKTENFLRYRSSRDKGQDDTTTANEKTGNFLRYRSSRDKNKQRWRVQYPRTLVKRQKDCFCYFITRRVLIRDTHATNELTKGETFAKLSLTEQVTLRSR
ncbi:hypothetical protein J6590_053753 [Homalodisca vitripennis]|nr:hypothetical protein J6590_053753 [Homalodisca vitripennis]